MLALVFCFDLEQYSYVLKETTQEYGADCYLRPLQPAKYFKIQIKPLKELYTVCQQKVDLLVLF